MVSQFALCTVWALASFLPNSSNQELRWNDHYGTAKTAAQSAERPMVVVLEDPSEKEKSFDDQNLSQENREKLFGDRFELCRVDVSTEYGKRVAQAFGAQTLPYTAVTDLKSRQIVYRKAGPMTSADWTKAIAKSSQVVRSEGRYEVRKVSTDGTTSTMYSEAPVYVSSPTTYAAAEVQYPAASPTPAYSTGPVFTDFGAPVRSYGVQPYYAPSFCPSCQRR